MSKSDSNSSNIKVEKLLKDYKQTLDTYHLYLMNLCYGVVSSRDHLYFENAKKILKDFDSENANEGDIKSMEYEIYFMKNEIDNLGYAEERADWKWRQRVGI